MILYDDLKDCFSEFEFILGYSYYLMANSMRSLYMEVDIENREDLDYLDDYFNVHKLDCFDINSIYNDHSHEEILNIKKEINSILSMERQKKKIVFLTRVNVDLNMNSTIEIIEKVNKSQEENLNFVRNLALSHYNDSSLYLNKAVTSSKSIQQSRFIVVYMSKVQSELIELSSNINNENLKANLIYNLHKSNKYLSKLYLKSLSDMKNNLNLLSSSFYFQLGEIFRKGIGIEQNENLFFKFSLFGLFSFSNTLSNGSCLCYFRRNKILKQIETNSNFRSVITSLEKLKSSFENSLCDICYERPKQTVLFPCNHYVCCYICMQKILFNSKCPICRAEIYLFV
jgi:hypothetical protein